MGTDMQKDTVITDIISVNLNDDKVNKAIKIGIDKLTVNGEDWILILDYMILCMIY